MTTMTDVKSALVSSAEGWRVELRAFGRAFRSRPYLDKACAASSAEQQPMLIERLVQGDMLGGYSSLTDFLDKLVSWFEWEEMMEGNAEQIALTLKIKQEALSSKQLLEQIQAFTIYDQQGLDIAGAIAKDVKARWKSIEAERKKITTPLWQAFQNVQALFKEPLDYYANIESLLKAKIVDAQRRAKAAQDEALLLAQQAHQAGNREQLAVAMQQAHQAETVTPEGLQNRSSWAYEVIDLSQVPMLFWMLDHQKLGAYVRETKGTVVIPGVRVYEVQGMAVKA
jgi:hypothetical protein